MQKISFKQQQNLNKTKGVTLIVLVVTIVVLLILAGVSIVMLTNGNGIINNARKAKDLTEISSEEEYILLTMLDEELTKIKIGQELKDMNFNTTEDIECVMDKETGIRYGWNWYLIRPEDIKDYELKNSYIVNYETEEYIRFDKNKHTLLTNNLLCIKDGLVYSADPKNMANSESWGDAILHNFIKGDANSGWSENALMFDGVDDGIEVKDNADYSKGITLEIYFSLKGKGTANYAQILMMKRNNTGNGFFMFIGNGEGDKNEHYEFGKIHIDIGGASQRLFTNTVIKENVPTYITYTYNPDLSQDNGVLYINGKKTETTNLGNIQNLINVSKDTPIQIGSDIYQTIGVENRKYPFYGDIYASRVYNRPLTESEVEYNYKNTVYDNNQ